MIEYIVGVTIPFLFIAGGFIYKKNKFHTYEYSYIYLPQNKPRLRREDRKSIEDFPKSRFVRFYDQDPLRSKREGDIIKGFDSFRINLIKFLINERWRAPEYKDNIAVSYDINKALNFEDFYNMSDLVYDEILEVFGAYISQIHSISKLKDGSGFIIEISLNNYYNIQKIFIPNLNDLKQQF